MQLESLICPIPKREEEQGKVLRNLYSLATDAERADFSNNDSVWLPMSTTSRKRVGTTPCFLHADEKPANKLFAVFTMPVFNTGAVAQCQNMQVWRFKRTAAAIIPIMLLCLQIRAESLSLPADVPINEGAGRGDHLIVQVRLGSGEEVPFVVDTGASITLLDKSFESKLKTRRGTAVVVRPGDKQTANIYAAPELYLRGVRLATGTNVFTYNFKRPMGILGMDCLAHYCIQLDFEAGQMRFLDSNDTTFSTAEFGKAFPLTFRKVGPAAGVFLPEIHHDSLIGENTNTVIDSGCNIDGLIEESDVKRLAVIFPERCWDGETYTNMIFAVVDRANVLGLGFLARHLVTLDFPHRMMYLEQTSVGPIARNRDALIEVAGKEIKPAAELLVNLKKSNQLPGWSNEDKRPIGMEVHSVFIPSTDVKGATLLTMHSKPAPNFVTFAFQREGDLPVCYYVIGRLCKEGDWRLRKAWQTNPANRKVIVYCVPRYADSR